MVNIEGHPKEFDFRALALPEAMARSLARAFAAQSRGWTGHSSAQAYWGHLTLFAQFLNGLDQVPDDLDGLTAATLKRWRARHGGRGPNPDRGTRAAAA
ncbi:hypothetical protein ABTY61_23425 [Kitasatospora sp. NPDC096128]|uniref:hypothetical protein n=1 Tax=Kitasatospora sp. NPDC096128 TaxID=3155547 RepID=UPI00331D1389